MEDLGHVALLQVEQLVDSADALGMQVVEHALAEGAVGGQAALEHVREGRVGAGEDLRLVDEELGVGDQLVAVQVALDMAAGKRCRLGADEKGMGNGVVGHGGFPGSGQGATVRTARTWLRQVWSWTPAKPMSMFTYQLS